MTDRPEGTLSSPVNSLTDLIRAEDTLDEVLAHVGRLGITAMEGWDAAAVTLVEQDRAVTFGATDERIAAIDQSQYDAGTGPCVDASKGSVEYFDGMETPPRWRNFAEGAAEKGIYSVASFPMQVGSQNIGALNFYSTQRDALRNGQREEGQTFAAEAATIVHAVKEMRTKESTIEHLHVALETRTIIGQATGLLMAHEGMTGEEAFQKLVSASQGANIKLRDIATRYVSVWEAKAGRTK